MSLESRGRARARCGALRVGCALVRISRKLLPAWYELRVVVKRIYLIVSQYFIEAQQELDAGSSMSPTTETRAGLRDRKVSSQDLVPLSRAGEAAQ